RERSGEKARPGAQVHDRAPLARELRQARDQRYRVPGPCPVVVGEALEDAGRPGVPVHGDAVLADTRTSRSARSPSGSHRPDETLGLEILHAPLTALGVSQVPLQEDDHMRASMKACVLFGFVAVVGGSAEAAQELDAAKADPQHHKVEFENDWVRVLRFRISPHEKTPLHDHPSVVVLYLTDGDLKLTPPDGEVSEAHPKAGAASWRGPTAHTVENIGAKPVEGIGVEPKGAGNPAWTPPTRDAVKVNAHDNKMEFENDQVRIIRVTVGKGESEPMHE